MFAHALAHTTRISLGQARPSLSFPLLFCRSEAPRSTSSGARRVEPPILAQLCEKGRLHLTPEEITDFTPKIIISVDWFSQLRDVDVGNVTPTVRVGLEGGKDMALRQVLGESTGEVMREDALPCSRITNALAGATSVGGFLCAWPSCVIYYGPRMTRPRLFRWQLCGAVSSATAMAVYARMWEPACEPQNIAACDIQRV